MRLPLLAALLALPVAAADAEPRFAALLPAMAKVSFTVLGIEVDAASGFFVDAQGTLLTSARALNDALSPGFALPGFRLADGALARSYRIGDCTDDRKLDLCRLKVSAKPAAWLTVPKDAAAPAAGTKVWLLGTTRASVLAPSEGIVRGRRRGEGGVEELEVATSVSRTERGGPVVDAEGRLVGMTASIRGGVVGVTPTAEVARYLAKPPVLQEFLPYVRGVRDLRKRRTREQRGELSAASWPKRVLTLRQRSLELRMPEEFGTCLPLPTVGNTEQLECPGRDATFFVSWTAGTPEGLLALNGKRASSPVLLPVLAPLLRAGRSPTLDQRKVAYSVPGTFRCFDGRSLRSPLPFVDGTAVCVLHDMNVRSPGDGMYSDRRAKGADVYDFAIRVPDPVYEEYYFALPSEVAQSARSSEIPRGPAGETPEKKKTPER